MGLEFIERTLKTFAVVMLIVMPFGVYYAGFFPTLAFLSGGVWGMINLLLITSMVHATIRREGPDTRRAVIVGIVKFPLLYLAGYFLLKIHRFDALVLLAGFSSLLAILVLKALGRLLHGADVSDGGKSSARALP